jgi:hypothetical protein
MAQPMPAVSHGPSLSTALCCVQYLGRHRYALTLTTHARRAVFVEAEVVDLVFRQILRAETEKHFADIAH